MTTATAPKAGKGLLGAIRSFNGIEIVTIAVFAVLFRVSMFPYRLTSAVFPYNIFIRFFFDALLCAMAVTIIRKRGVLASYVIVWWLINYVVEGEDLVWLIGMWPPIILGEWYLSRQNPYGGSRRNIIIGVGLLYGAVFGATYWLYLLTYYQLVYSLLPI
ncbi:MAG TPA: hypothetical protein VLC52_05305, partial [Anaerolineae bacterium]|nr:hypothetical protein [Anaerolineae bacterium]